MNWILVTVIILIGGGAFLGWRAGLIKTVFSLISTIAVLILTMIFSPVVTNVLKSSDLVTNTIYNGLASVINLSGIVEVLEKEDNDDYPIVVTEYPGAIEVIDIAINPIEVIENLELPDSIRDMLLDVDILDTIDINDIERWNGYPEEAIEWIETKICNLLTETILNAIGFFVTFLIASVGVAILCFTLDIISKLPVLHQINTLSGALVGALEGLVLVWIGFIIITMLGSTAFGQEALGLITESELLSYLYNNNILSKSIL